MRFSRQLCTALAPAFGVLLLATGMTWACSVPVFRYALEHWEADPFQAILFHRGALTPEQKSQARALRPEDEVWRANLSVTMVDVGEEMSPEVAEVWKQQSPDVMLPHVTARFPRRSGIDGTFLSAPLAEAAKLNLADSPARRDIVGRFQDGQSAVWVMIDSGDAARDDAAARTLEERLEYLMGVLALPELDQMDIVNGLISVGQDELRLEFSVLRIARNDPEERAFVSMLLGTEPDLASLEEPIVFPIFGRGRALYALAGKGIRAETIDRAATFLIGKCSCQVKDQNPGTDLLFTADWKALAKASPLLERELPDLSHLAQAAAPVTVTTKTEDSEIMPNLGVSSVLALLGVAMAFGAWRLVRKGR